MSAGGAKSGLVERFKAHPVGGVLTLLAFVLLPITALLANLGTFFDTETGKSVINIVGQEDGTGDQSTTVSQSPSKAEPVAPRAMPTAAGAPMVISVTAVGGRVIQSKASILEQRLVPLLDRLSERQVLIEITISNLSGPLNNQSLDARAKFTIDGKTIACQGAPISFGSDAELSRALARSTETKFKQFEGGMTC